MMPKVLSSVNLKDAPEWTILILELDEASKIVGERLRDVYKEMVLTVELDVDRFDKEEVKKSLSEIQIPNTRVLGAWGDGRFHNFTYTLCTGIADRRSKSYGYIHIDHHSDSGDYDATSNFSGSAFVSTLLRDSNAKTVRFIGSEGLKTEEKLEGKFSRIRYVLEEDLRMADSFEDSIKYLLKGTPKDVYVSIDLDVVDMMEVTTSFRTLDWGGTLTGGELSTILGLIDKRKNIIGADVSGFDGRGLGIQLYEVVINTLIKKIPYKSSTAGFFASYLDHHTPLPLTQT